MIITQELFTYLNACNEGMVVANALNLVGKDSTTIIQGLNDAGYPDYAIWVSNMIISKEALEFVYSDNITYLVFDPINNVYKATKDLLVAQQLKSALIDNPIVTDKSLVIMQEQIAGENGKNFRFLIS